MQQTRTVAKFVSSFVKPFKSQRALLIGFLKQQAMAKSNFEYVRKYERDEECLPNCWMVVRIDGRTFHKFTDVHEFEKPNDERGLGLMSKAATRVMDVFNEICLAYGQSDEYSFIFRKDAEIFNRRAMKIMSNVCSEFTANYQFHWNDFFPSTKLQYPPTFDARIVLYPTNQSLRDYLSWRQVDCHVNNLYNTTFWSLVLKGNVSRREAEKRLCGTVSSDKNEILFSQFGINYNNEPNLYKKGTILVRSKCDLVPADESNLSKNKRTNSGFSVVEALHVDLIKNEFWEQHPDILGPFANV